MTTHSNFAGFSPRNIVRNFLVLLLYATPLTAFAQQSAPPGSASAPTIAENLTVTPKFGQSQEQLASDRADCRVWAKGQTGFDPGQIGGGVTPSDYNLRRQQYGRALAACMEGRGYSTHFAAPAGVVAAPLVAAPAVVAVSSTRPELKYHPFSMHIDGGYTVTSGDTNQYVDGGPYAGLGLTWFPTSTLPLGIRVDGSYNWLRAKDHLLSTGNYSSGDVNVYGGDVDVQLNLAHRSSASQFYLLGGIGRYREQTVLKQVSYVNGIICGYYYCWPGYFPAVTAEQRTTSDWHRAWNAGAGWEHAISHGGASFFIEARYLRIMPDNNPIKLVPITFGFRF